MYTVHTVGTKLHRVQVAAGGPNPKHRLSLCTHLFHCSAPVVVDRDGLELVQAHHATLRRRLLALVLFAQEFRRLLRVRLLVEGQTKQKVAEAQQDASRGCYPPPRVVRRHDPLQHPSQHQVEQRKESIVLRREEIDRTEGRAVGDTCTLLASWLRKGWPEHEACSSASLAKLDLSTGEEIKKREKRIGLKKKCGATKPGVPSKIRRKSLVPARTSCFFWIPVDRANFKFCIYLVLSLAGNPDRPCTPIKAHITGIKSLVRKIQERHTIATCELLLRWPIQYLVGVQS